MPPIERAAFDFEREIAPHLPVLYRMARRLTGRREDAEDLVQSTLERAYRKRARYRPGTNLGAWLMTILTRLTIDDRRRAARTPDKVPLDQVDRSYERRVVHAGAMPSPVEARVLGRLAAAAILDTVTTLSPGIRVVMQATAAGFSNVEIARRLGIPAATVRSRLRRGRQRLDQGTDPARDIALMERTRRL
jgi:RNA polymerase sigma-70 factor, ECF subfamily